MDCEYHVPTPKTPTKRSIETDRDTRLQAHTLYYCAGWTMDNIALQLGLTLHQVRWALCHRLTPQKAKTGRRTLLDTPQRKRLIEFITQSKQSRRISPEELGQTLFNCGPRAIRTALKKEGYTRAIARRKPPISEQNRIERLAWAWEHIFWLDEQWDTILWSDESWVNPGKHRKDWIIRKIGSEELFHPDCVQARYQRKIGWMFWGSISDKYGRHRGVFWEKDWETINEGGYSGIIILIIDDILRQCPELQFQQDNAKGYFSKFTLSVLERAQIKVMKWPANSPDLNPIETVWDRLKNYIQEHYPKVHSSYNKLKLAVQEAWESVTHEQIRGLIREMRDRCQAVIAAQGHSTKY